MTHDVTRHEHIAQEPRRSARDAVVYAAVTLTILALVVWAPLRYAAPHLIATDHITDVGYGWLLWFVAALSAFATIAAGAALSLRKPRDVAPILGCAAAGLGFYLVTHTMPIW